ncbi:MAG: hypothetical protein IT332_07345 [Ardenticatenales bacterium]|nr:hypothetical protein [Ardenticatenales bacterium]
MTEPTSANPYDAAFIAAQKERLLAERAQMQQEIANDSEELKAWMGDTDGGDTYMSEDATALTERELDMTLINNAQTMLRDIEDALAAIDAGTYGWDEDAGVWIRAERLEVLPWARHEVKVERRRRDDDDLALDVD